ncbi:hypothetical protein ZOSMA_216G00070 [Zostera marina]|uniref:Uncharacterized protein n=1 Tax=Zostera marina TaxID=29655 RepID=A0A0K9PJV6_ZOSMR|nr:hypothetical protein ZOSMA_216G00070 [Zostera marina]
MLEMGLFYTGRYLRKRLARKDRPLVVRLLLIMMSRASARLA